MKVIFLGTNGWYDTDTGNTICTLIKASRCNIFLDAGFGLAKADRYLDPRNPTYIFLSHLHLDHVIGLHALAKFKMPKGLFVIVPREMNSALKTLFDSPYTMPPKVLAFPTSIKTISEELKIPGAVVQTRKLIHRGGCFGYRFTFDKKVISYCTDTGVCDNFKILAKDADLLITECALRKGQDDSGWPHLDPVAAAKLAKEAKVKRMILTHFDAHNYKNKDQRKRAQEYAVKIFPKSIAAEDGVQITV
ncbi:MAG: ribonuclease Z [Candidatus Omnitrophota bacterium]